MQTLMPLLTEAELSMLGAELERLFSLHDRPFDTKKKATFVAELARCGVAFTDLLQGIADLKVKSMDRITAPAIIAAARTHVVMEDPNPAESCGKCISGMIVMRDDSRAQFTLACDCSAGSRHAGLIKWNGMTTQESRGRRLELVA